MAAASIDVDQPAKYPIVLSDALLGKASKDLYTSIRCQSEFRTLLSHWELLKLTDLR